MNNAHWFAVRCVIEACGSHPDCHNLHLYEERVTIWHCAEFDDAISRAEREARDYATGIGGQYAGLAQCYQFENPIDGAEVFSLLRESELATGIYIDTFFDTGAERQHDAES